MPVNKESANPHLWECPTCHLMANEKMVAQADPKRIERCKARGQEVELTDNPDNLHDRIVVTKTNEPDPGIWRAYRERKRGEYDATNAGASEKGKA